VHTSKCAPTKFELDMHILHVQEHNGVHEGLET
jgi:hypothetical protein